LSAHRRRGINQGASPASLCFQHCRPFSLAWCASTHSLNIVFAAFIHYHETHLPCRPLSPYLQPEQGPQNSHQHAPRLPVCIPFSFFCSILCLNVFSFVVGTTASSAPNVICTRRTPSNMPPLALCVLRTHPLPSTKDSMRGSHCWWSGLWVWTYRGSKRMGAGMPK